MGVPSCRDSAGALRPPLTGRWWNGRGEDGETGQKLLFYLLSVHYFSQPCRDGVIHLEYANSWQRICLLVLDLPLGGRSPTQLLSLSSVCLKTPVIHPHSATLRQSHFSTSHPRRVCLGAAGMGRGGLNEVGGGGASQGVIFVATVFRITAAWVFLHFKSCYYTSDLHVID